MRALLLAVGTDRYGLPMVLAREVLAAPVLTPVPTAPAVVLGLVNLRGEIVPVLDTAALLGLSAERTAQGPGAVVVVDTPRGPAGLSADAVPRPVVLREATGGSDLPGTVATYAVDGLVAVLLDVERLLDPQRIGAAG